MTDKLVVIVWPNWLTLAIITLNLFLAIWGTALVRKNKRHARELGDAISQLAGAPLSQAKLTMTFSKDGDE